MELKEIQEKVNEEIQQLGGYWKPLEMFVALVEEVGELGKELNDLYGPKRKKKNTKGLKEEIGDVFNALICIANLEGIDLEETILNVINKSITRDKHRFK